MIPLPLLPEIFFYDIDKEKQVYDDPPKAIFRLNIIGNMSGFDLRLRPYTDRWFSTLTKVFTDNFKDQLGEIASFVMGKDKKQEEEEDEYMRLKALSDAMDEEGEDEEAEVEGEPEGPPTALFNIWKFLKGLFEKIKTLVKWLNKLAKFALRLAKKVIKGLRKWVKRGIKIAKKLLKSLIKIGRRVWKVVRNLLLTCWRKVKVVVLRIFERVKSFVRFILQALRPIIKAAMRMLVIYSLKAGKIFKYLLAKPFRKFLLPILKKIGKMMLKRLPAILVRKGVARGVIDAFVKKLTAAVAALPAIGTGIGTVIDVGLWIWTIYDVITLGYEVYEGVSEFLTEANIIADDMQKLMDENNHFKFGTPKEIAELLTSDNPYKYFNMDEKYIKQKKAIEENQKMLTETMKNRQEDLLHEWDFYSYVDSYQMENNIFPIVARIRLFQETMHNWLKRIGADAVSLSGGLDILFMSFHKKAVDYLDQYSLSAETVIKLCNTQLPPQKDQTKVTPPKRKTPQNEEEAKETFYDEMRQIVEASDSWYHDNSLYKWIKIPSKWFGRDVKKENKIPEEFYDLEYADKLKWVEEHKSFIEHDLFGEGKGLTVYAPKLVELEAKDYQKPQLEQLAQKKRLLELILDKFQRIQNFYHNKIEIPV